MRPEKESKCDKKFEDVFPLLPEDDKQWLSGLLKKLELSTSSAVNVKGDTVFFHAAINNKVNLSQKLIECGASVYAKDDEHSLLSFTAERGLNDIIALLIRFDAKRFLADQPERALRCAVAHNRKAIVEILLSNCPYDPIKDSLTFIDAAKFDGLDFLELMLKKAPHSEEVLIQALSGAVLWDAQKTIKKLIGSMNASSIIQAFSNVDDIHITNQTMTLVMDALNRILLPGLIADRDALIGKFKKIATPPPDPKIIYEMERLPLSMAFKTLYQLADGSEQGLKDKKWALGQTANVSDLYAPLREHQLELELERQVSSGKIGYIGYLYLGITILANGDLDLAKYLEHYALSEQAVKNQLDKNKPQASNNANKTSAFFQSNFGVASREEKDRLPRMAHLSECVDKEHLEKIKCDLNKILGISDNLVTEVKAGMAILHTAVVISFNMDIRIDLYEHLLEQKLLADIKDIKLSKCIVFTKLEIPDDSEIYNRFMKNIETAVIELDDMRP